MPTNDQAAVLEAFAMSDPGAPALSWRGPSSLNDTVVERLWAASEELTGVAHDRWKV